MSLLAQFLLRLAFGLAFGMAITSSRLVSSGFFRNHLYVTLGLTTLAALVSYAVAPIALWCSITAAVASYAGAVCWLYEKPIGGKVALAIVALLSLTAALSILPPANHRESRQSAFEPNSATPQRTLTESEIRQVDESKERMTWMYVKSDVLNLLSNVSSGLLMGLTFASMLLGHWYLNSPGMQLAPLRRLLLATGTAVGLQAIVSALGLMGELEYGTAMPTYLWLFILLRWSFGLIGVAILIWMAWQTLKIPNTQSATGILYVAVIGVFIGELAAGLLSVESTFPL